VGEWEEWGKREKEKGGRYIKMKDGKMENGKEEKNTWGH
jgi:hypothetical protein